MTTLGLQIEPGQVIPLVAIGGGLAFLIISVVFSAVKGMVQHRESEQTRREIAAYVAEGSMTPDDAEAILASGKRRRCGGSCACSRKKSGTPDRAFSPQHA